MSIDKALRAEALQADGRTVAEIAVALQVTRQRVRQLLSMARAERDRATSVDPFARLSARTANSLKAEFLYLRRQALTVESVAAALSGGRLRRVRNLGKKGVAEIERWLATECPAAAAPGAMPAQRAEGAT